MYSLEHLCICPFSRAIFLTLVELNIGFEVVAERNLNGIDFFYSSSSKKTFSNYPKLIIDKELEVESFYGIVEYLSSSNPENKVKLFGNSLKSEIQSRTIMNWIDRELFQNILKVILYEKIFKTYHNKKNPSPDSALIREVESNLKKYLLHIQSMLDSHEYIASNSITVADFLLAGHISLLDYFNHIIWGVNLKRLHYWYSILKSRSNFKTLLQMRIQGFQPSRQYASVDF